MYDGPSIFKGDSLPETELERVAPGTPEELSPPPERAGVPRWQQMTAVAGIACMLGAAGFALTRYSSGPEQSEAGGRNGGAPAELVLSPPDYLMAADGSGYVLDEDGNPIPVPPATGKDLPQSDDAEAPESTVNNDPAPSTGSSTPAAPGTAFIQPTSQASARSPESASTTTTAAPQANGEQDPATTTTTTAPEDEEDLPPVTVPSTTTVAPTTTLPPETSNPEGEGEQPTSTTSVPAEAGTTSTSTVVSPSTAAAETGPIQPNATTTSRGVVATLLRRLRG